MLGVLIPCVFAVYTTPYDILFYNNTDLLNGITTALSHVISITAHNL